MKNLQDAGQILRDINQTLEQSQKVTPPGVPDAAIRKLTLAGKKIQSSLKEIYDGRLYEEYGTFENFAEKRLSIDKKTAQSFVKLWEEEARLKPEVDIKDKEENLIWNAYRNGGGICMKPGDGQKLVIHQNPNDESHVLLENDMSNYVIFNHLTPEQMTMRLEKNRLSDANYPLGPFCNLSNKSVEIPIVIITDAEAEEVIKYTKGDTFPSLTVRGNEAKDFYENVKNSPVAEVMGIQDNRQRRPVTPEPLSTRERIEERNKKYEVFESMFGMSRRFDNEVNASRQFHLLLDQREDLELARTALCDEDDSIGSRKNFMNVMMPFEKFSIVLDNTRFIESIHDCPDEICTHEQKGNLINFYKPCGYFIEGSFETEVWYVHEKYITRNNYRDMHLYLTVKLDFIKGSIEFPYDEGNQTIASFRPVAERMVAFILNFLLVLNHRKVKVVDIKPEAVVQRPQRENHRKIANWQDKLSDGSNRPHWKIHIPATQTLYKRLNESAQGINVNERREHDVRGHLRTDKYGRKRIQVIPHKRCRGSSKPYFQRNYDAANVGMEY